MNTNNKNVNKYNNKKMWLDKFTENLDLNVIFINKNNIKLTYGEVIAYIELMDSNSQKVYKEQFDNFDYMYGDIEPLLKNIGNKINFSFIEKQSKLFF